MNNARIVRLDDLGAGKGLEISTFEQAFEGYSNASGKRKNKPSRAQKKIARTKDRQAVNAVKDELHNEKNAGRIGRRGVKKSARQDIKDDQTSRRQGRKDYNQDERQTRKDTGKVRRTDRKNYGAEEDYEEPTDETATDDTMTQGPDDAGTYSEDTGYDGQDYAPEETDNTGGDDYRDDQNAQDDDYDQDSDSSGAGFDEEYGSLNGIDEHNVIVEMKSVPAPVMEAVKGISAHMTRVDYCTKLKDKGQTTAGPQVFCKFDGPDDDLDTMINTSNARIIDLSGKLDKYISANGEQARKNVALAKRHVQKIKPTMMCPDLMAEASKNKIVVPPAPASSFDAVDTDNKVHQNYQTFIDGSEGRLFDIYSAVDGSGDNKVVSIGLPILAGVVASITAIVLYNQFKGK